MTAALEYFNKTSDELADALLALKKEQFNLRFQKASGQLDNTARMRQVRRDIAKVKTVLGMRDSEGNPLPGVKLPKPANEAAKPKKTTAKKPTVKKVAAPAEDKVADEAPKKAAAKKAPAKKAAASDKPKKAPATKAAPKAKAGKKADTGADAAGKTKE